MVSAKVIRNAREKKMLSLREHFIFSTDKFLKSWIFNFLFNGNIFNPKKGVA